MNTKKTNFKYLAIIFYLAVIVGGGILLYQYWREPMQENKLSENKLSQQLVIDITTRVEALLPKNSFLRELALIPDIFPESYLLIYVEDPKFNEIPKDASGYIYMSCPEVTEGQAIEGIYHLALFQNNSIVNDKIIPVGDNVVFNNSEEAGESAALRQKLVFKNTKINIYWMFNGLEPSKQEEYNLEKVTLINFKDYTGDGQKYEFKLIGATFPCGHTEFLIAGYDQENNKAVVYPVVENQDTFYWRDNFDPDSVGKVEWRFQCGDHGNDLEEYKLYQFNTDQENYILTEDKETPCPN